MGNRYSFVREEEEEAEFRRLVEAVEIAQRRATGHSDIEAGLHRPTVAVAPIQGLAPHPNTFARNDGNCIVLL